jgi:hypothetical protein
MNENYRRVPTKFAPEIRFEVTPVPPAPFRAVQETALERLKSRLLLERLRELSSAEFNCEVRRAANEAAELAWVTCYPLLVFPALFEEKAETVLANAVRREPLRTRSLEMLAA